MRRGSYAVEFALLAPLLLVLLAGVIDLGQYLVAANALSMAVNEGARTGALSDPDGSDPIAMAEDMAMRSFDANELRAAAVFTVTYAGRAAPDERIVVDGRATVEPWFGILALPRTVSHTSVVRLAFQP